MHYREVPYVQGNPRYSPGISYQTTEHWSIFCQHNAGLITHKHTYTQTHTHITDGSIFISELLSFKPGVLLSQQLEKKFKKLHVSFNSLNICCK